LFDFINSHLCLIIFIFIMTMIIIVIIIFFMMIITIILCTNFKHVNCKFWICHLDITMKNSLYWILNVEIHLDAMDFGLPLKKERNKASRQLFFSFDNNIKKRNFTSIMNLFHVFVWLNKAIKFLMKNHEIRLICSIPRSECCNKYYEFISCLCMAKQSNELLIENHETCLIGSAPFP